MSNLVIGHVAQDSARVWVRGDKTSKAATLRYRETGATAWISITKDLEPFRGFIEIMELTGLSASTDYECQLSFKAGSPAPAVKAGVFRTAPNGLADISFFLGSCNWSRGGLIKIGNAKESWEGIVALVEALRPEFMIHCGDQVYSDVIFGPLPQFMHLEYYRSLYQKAWGVKPTAEVLAALPNYMILDDHEIFDDFYDGKPYAGEPSQTIADFAKKAYAEYQHSHNPQDFSPAFYYSFEHGGAQFFALDVRTERHVGPNATICSPQQLDAFKDWLLTHKAAVKFAVTSVPFVAEVRTGNDKWSGTSFRAQREELMDFMAGNDVGKLVFLTGDMHCSYHATMTLRRTGGGEVTLHELMSSPINQVGSRTNHGFVTSLSARTAEGTDYTIEMKDDEFYGEHSNIMRIAATAGGEVSWDLYRTKGVLDPPEPVLPGTPFQL